MHSSTGLWIILHCIGLCLTTSLPAPKSETTLSLKGSHWVLKDLNEEFKGIWWNEAFLHCDLGQLDKIIFSHRKAGEMVQEGAGEEIYNSEAFERYFRYYHNFWMGHGQAIQNGVMQIFPNFEDNIRRIQKYPKLRNPTPSRAPGLDQFRMEKRVIYRCKVPDAQRKKCSSQTGAMATQLGALESD
ncbi:hypothetical protein P154DRAFT_607985 [Amniculicola lignicola CBS 123094]|uniref:Uncharacterized protein n=1 Tax=Amniculicola lignicola CBS 123094 TaxID=1392246 RepID=A0A6A5W754_9PLEO|nr:hypothetical protein P154DRAFT_607985 [Amniculicola lignicola CBS 123094]